MTRRIVAPHDLCQMQALADQGFTHAEIAARTGWSYHTVKNNVRTGVYQPSPAQLAEMTSLARDGLSREDIVAITGWSYRTVKKHVGHIARGEPGRPTDLARYRRMLKAVSSAEYGDRDGIARRFGLKDADVLRVVLVRARRAVAAALPATDALAAVKAGEDERRSHHGA